MVQNVLIVDDRPENLYVLENTLDQPNINCIKAESGEEALRSLLHNNISLILMDVQMPGMDGFETAKLIHENPTKKHIPIIFVSAISKEQKHIFKGYQSGAIDYIFKPYDPDILRSKVNILLELNRKQKQIEMQNIALNQAKKETDDLLKNVQEGLFLLDEKLHISGSYSSALQQILEEDSIGGKSILSLLENRISEESYQNCTTFFELSFDPNIAEESLNDLNPLNGINYTILQNNGQEPKLKHLYFSCRRIYNNETIEKLIFTVSDKTKEHKLEEQVKIANGKAQRQMECLFSILRVEPKLLNDFIESAKKDINESKTLISKHFPFSNCNEILTELFHYLHQIKGNASVLDLKKFVEVAHKGEEIISKLQKNERVTEEDLTLLQDIVDNLENWIEDITGLISKIGNIYKYFRPKRTYEVELLIQSLKSLIHNLQGESEKRVELVHDKFDGMAIPYNWRLDLKDILVQLTRNAVYHGIETVDERKKKKKAPIGKIVIETSKVNNHLDLIFKDDGRGIQVKTLKDIAIKNKKIAAAELNKWSSQQIQKLIFEPDISTVDTADHTAGRGIGMNIVDKLVKKQGGNISVSSKPGKFTEFRISVPVK